MVRLWTILPKYSKHQAVLILQIASLHTHSSCSAGITDSALTNHGVLQTRRLGEHLASSGHVFSNIFSSDLQRALKTAQAICAAQPGGGDGKLTVEQNPLLRELDFGSKERQRFQPDSNSSKDSQKIRSRQKLTASFQPQETRESMIARADKFLDDHLIDLIGEDESSTKQDKDRSAAIVSHGMFLSTLWKRLLILFDKNLVSASAGVLTADRLINMEHLGAWSNTGYLELLIRHQPSADVDGASALAPAEVNAGVETEPKIIPRSRQLKNSTMLIEAVNKRDHLKNLKRTGGGVGSSKHDEGQKTIESFFKKRRVG
jgi:broad specificity phosphatase PhoE